MAHLRHLKSCGESKRKRQAYICASLHFNKICVGDYRSVVFLLCNCLFEIRELETWMGAIM